MQRALLDAAGDELRSIEMSAAKSIVALHDGTLVALDLALGQTVRIGDTVARLRAGAAEEWQALAFVPAQDAEEPAEIALALAGEPRWRAFGASVLEVSSRPIATPDWLLELGFSAAAPAHLLRLALPGAASAEPSPGEGATGTVRVSLGKRSLATLLLTRGI